MESVGNLWSIRRHRWPIRGRRVAVSWALCDRIVASSWPVTGHARLAYSTCDRKVGTKGPPSGHYLATAAFSMASSRKHSCLVLWTVMCDRKLTRQWSIAGQFSVTAVDYSRRSVCGARKGQQRTTMWPVIGHILPTDSHMVNC